MDHIETGQAQRQPGETLPDWGVDLAYAVCERCDWKFFVPAGLSPGRCPHCFENALSQPDETVEQSAAYLPYAYPPELVLPFTRRPQALQEGIEQFAKGIPFPPVDLTHQNLSARLNKVFIPMWLVDAEIQATWQAEVGFDYEVVSHQDRYDDNRGGWVSREVTEGRIRWEPRQGRLQRTYSNRLAPALEEDARLKRRLGDFSVDGAAGYQSEAIQQAMVRVPDRIPEDAWPEAVPAFQAAAAEECRQAAGADHIRLFQWDPRFQERNWSLLLYPVYTTFYQDDEQTPQPVMIHGQTGRVSGARRASWKRGQRAALVILGVATILFLISLLLAAGSVLSPPLLALGGIGLLVALFTGLAALVPLGVVWQFNRSQKTP